MTGHTKGERTSCRLIPLDRLQADDTMITRSWCETHGEWASCPRVAREMIAELVGALEALLSGCSMRMGAEAQDDGTEDLSVTLENVDLVSYYRARSVLAKAKGD